MKPISAWIEKRAQITPNRVALIDQTEQLTYKQMQIEIDRWATYLKNEQNIEQTDRIGLYLHNRIEYIILFFAIAKLGAIAVPLNTRLTLEELSYQINDSKMKTLLTEMNFHHMATQLKLKHPQLQTQMIESIILPALQEETSFPTIDASTPFIICYTSGTTGRPKGAVLTQENMFWNAVNNCTAIDLTSNDRSIVLLPLFHIGGIGLFAFPTLFAGGSVAVLGKFDPEQALQMIERDEISVVMGVPTIFDAIRKHKRFQSTDFSSIRWLCSGGAPCPKELIEFYLKKGLPFSQGYGLTEGSPTVFMLSKEDYRRKIGSVGKPALFTDIRIVDGNGCSVLAGDVGELVVKGSNIIKEYWGLPEETEKAFVDGWFHTGDLVKADEEGFVYIVGRKKEMIISGGENVYPLEIEQVINEEPSIDEVAVIGVADDKWGEVPIAFVVLKEGRGVTEEDLRMICSEKLAKYKIPKSFIFLSELPKNATGKIDKKLLIQETTMKGEKR